MKLRPLFTLLFIGFGLFYLFKPASRLEFWKLTPVVAKSNPEAEPCFGKENCILVYSAPWCPNCENIIGCLKNLEGASIYIGMDTVANSEAMAKKIGVNSFIDSDGSVKRSLGIHSVPTFLALDANGKVKSRFSGAPVPCNQSSVKALLKIP